MPTCQLLLEQDPTMHVREANIIEAAVTPSTMFVGVFVDWWITKFILSIAIKDVLGVECWEAHLNANMQRSLAR